MQSNVLTLSQRRERAEQNRSTIQRFLQGKLGTGQFGDCRCFGDELAIRLADDVRQWRAQQRAMSAQLETAGAYLIPQTFADFTEAAMLYASALRDWATTVPTERGGGWRLPMIDDTQVEGTIVPENSLPSPNPQDITSFSALTLYTQKFSSNWLVIPFELMEDVPDLIERSLAGAVGRRIGRLQNTTFTPQIVAQATLGVTTALATAIAADEVVDLYYSIDPYYREQPGFCWQLNNNTAKYLRTLQDTAGRFIFRQRRQEDKYDLLLGKPAIINRDMPDIAASAIALMAGDFSKVVIRDVGREVRLKITTERWADYDQVGVIGFTRSEAAIADAGTHPIKYLQQHS